MVDTSLLVLAFVLYRAMEFHLRERERGGKERERREGRKEREEEKFIALRFSTGAFSPTKGERKREGEKERESFFLQSKY
jgi:hypothetical protein